MVKLSQEAKANYTEIVMAVGTARYEKSYLSVDLIAEAIVRGIGEDLETLIKWLVKIEEENKGRKQNKE